MSLHPAQWVRSVLPTIILLLCVVSTSKTLAFTSYPHSRIGSTTNNSCLSLNKALISPKHRIYKQLNRYYYQLSRPSNLRKLSGGTESPNPHGKITDLIKVGDYGVANWTKNQQIIVFFKRNQLALARSQMVGYFEEPCINCQDNRTAVESLEVILPNDANVTCLEKLYAENQRRRGIYDRSSSTADLELPQTPH